MTEEQKRNKAAYDIGYWQDYWEKNRERLIVNHREWKTMNRDRVAAYNRKWWQRNPAKVAAYKQKYALKIRAMSAVNNSIGAGYLQRASELSCKICGKQAHHYHHYLGYAVEHWYHVMPVCQKCHKRIHLKVQDYGNV